VLLLSRVFGACHRGGKASGVGNARSNTSGSGAVAALAADADRARWHGQSLSSGQLAQVYGFTDVDGSRPDAWRYMDEVQESASRRT
jgi:hypothetical protein